MKHSQSVMDSLADAETLRHIARAHYKHYSRTNLYLVDAYRSQVNVRSGWRTRSVEQDSEAAYWVRMAARAAFRAVPALRGDR